MQIAARSTRRSMAFVLFIALAVAVVAAPEPVGGAEAPVPGMEETADGAGIGEARKRFGIEGFKDVENIKGILAIVGGALLCGIVLSYHPSHRGRQAGLEEMDQPKIIITYTIVGALVGIVVAAEPSMGLAIFGIGGLMRFRTELSAPRETGRVILATIIGIFCGLEFWLVVVFAIVLAWLLILILDARIGYRMMVRGLEPTAVGDAARVYRQMIEKSDIVVTQEKKNVNKRQISFAFKARRSFDKEQLEQRCEEVPENLRGTVDWPEEG